MLPFTSPSPTPYSLFPIPYSVSVVIVSYNSEKFIRPCLDALSQSEYPIHEIVVVDNASKDDSASIIEQAFPQVRLVRSPRNLGFAGGCNLGISHSSGQIVALVNPDVVVQRTWLGELINSLAQDSSIAIAGCKLLYPDQRTIQHAGACLKYPLALSDHYGYRQQDDGKWDELRDVEYVTGAALVIRRNLLAQLDGFDETFFPAYFEEVDLCWRVRKAGLKVLYVPSAVAIHHETMSAGRHTYAQYYYFHLNRLRFVLKNYSQEQLLQDFFPAERDYLETISPEIETRAIDRAYAEILDDLRNRVSTTNVVIPNGALVQVMEGLQRQASQLSHTKSLAASTTGVITEISTIRQIPEPAFRSSIPLIGPLVSSFRSGWNWVSTKWYVRQILQEQNDVNAKLVGSLNDVARQLLELQKRVDEMELRSRENR